MNSSILLSIVLAILLLLFWTLAQMRLEKRLRRVSQQHRDLEVALSGFMEEFEKITLQFSRLIPQRQTAAPGAQPAVPAVLPYETELRQSVPAAVAATGVEKRHLVLGLAQKGGSVADIVGRLMIPRGEVELILNLSQNNDRLTARRFGQFQPLNRKRNSE